jgi:hypothetical protein
MNDVCPRRALRADESRQRGERASSRILTLMLGVLLAFASPIVAAAQAPPDSDTSRPGS